MLTATKLDMSEKSVGQDGKILLPNSEPFLPLDLYLEILGWLRVEDLLRCKSVCKKWFQMIEGREFIEMHMKRSVCRFLHKSHDGTSRRSDEVDLKFKILGHFEGLLVESCLSSQELRIRNPATRKILELPHPDHDTNHIIMSYVPSTGYYKLVSTCVGKKPSSKVLEIGSGNLVWKRLEILDQYFQDGVGRKFRDLMVRRGLYLLEFESGEAEILSMDVNEEAVKRCKVPKGIYSDSHGIIYWNDKLSIAGIVGEELHVWVLEDFKMQRWADNKIVIPLSFMKKGVAMEDKLWSIPYSGKGSTIWFWGNHGILFTYNFTTHRIEKVGYPPVGEVYICNYWPSLVTLKGMQAKERPSN